MPHKRQPPRITQVYLDTLESCDWCDSDVLDSAVTRLKQVFLSDAELRDTLDGLSAAARWFVENRASLPSHEEETILANLATAVSQEVEDEISSQDDPGSLGGDLATLEEISRMLAHDFSQEIDWLNEKLAEMGSLEDLDVGAPSSGHRPEGGCSVSIESMFEALLE